MSHDRNRLPYRQKFCVWEPIIYRSVNIWTGLKMRVLSDKIAATSFGVIFGPSQFTRGEVYHSPKLELDAYGRKSSLNLMLLVVEEWVLMLPPQLLRWSRVRLQQRSFSTTCPGKPER